MNIEPSDLLIRYLQQVETASEYDRSMFTIALFSGLAPDLWELHRDRGGRLWVHEEIVRSLLATASDSEIAAVMEDEIASLFDTHLLCDLWNRLKQSLDLRIQYAAARGLLEILRRSPQAVVVPHHFVDQLCSSSSREARVTGLKLLRYIDDMEARATMIVRSLRSSSAYERQAAIAGIVILSQEQIRQLRDGRSVGDVIQALRELVAAESDETVRVSGVRVLRELEHNTSA